MKMTDDKQSRYLTTAEAARYLRYSPDTFRRIAKTEKIPSMRLGKGRHPRYRQDVIMKWLESKQIGRKSVRW